MTTEAPFWESSALKNLQRAYEARGLRFYIHPPREVVPQFLVGFQPDAIALGPDGGIIIEVKLRKGPESEKQLAAIARKVSGQKGWEFRAIYVSPPADQTPPIANPTQEQLQAAFEEIEALTAGGHRAAALVAAWSALESLARLAKDEDEATKPRSFSPIQTVQTLAEEGYIENEAADRLREMASLRNALVHGDLSVHVSTEQVEGLLLQLRSIAPQVLSVTTRQGA